MKRFLAIVAAAAMCLVLAAPAGADSRVTVPIHGFLGGVDGAEAPVGCPKDAAWRYTNTGQGIVSHLGLVTSVVNHCSWLDTPTSGHFGPGTITVTAPDGDQLLMAEWGTFEIVMGPSGPLSLIKQQWTVTGGTGRFAHASGGGTANPVGDLVVGFTSGPIVGVIRYDASDRAGA